MMLASVEFVLEEDAVKVELPRRGVNVDESEMAALKTRAPPDDRADGR